jgi:hypothetical protein
MQLGRLAIGSAIALACAMGCHRETKPRAPQSAAPVIGTVRVPAGTMFTVRMIDPLSTDTAVPGRVFTARLRDPLLAPNGEQIAPAGAIVTGRVIAVQRGERPRLALSFDTIETFEGVAGIDTRAEPTMNAPFSIGQLRRPAEAQADVVLRPSEQGAIGGGPRTEEPTREPSVNVPFDTEIDLVLTKPLTVDKTR